MEHVDLSRTVFCSKFYYSAVLHVGFEREGSQEEHVGSELLLW